MMVNGALPKVLGVMFVLGGLAGCEGRGTNGLPFLASYDFEDGQAEGWQPNLAENWRIVGEDGSMVYQLVAPGEPGEVRAPTSWSLLSNHPVSSFVFSGRLKSHADPGNPNRDVCLFFHYRDPTHFYYVHFSASSDEVHNIIGLVDGADRIKVNRELAGASVFRLTDTDWHQFKLSFDAGTGEVQAFLDDMETPIVTASGLAFRDGLVGVGSFDDTGSFDDLRLWGETVSR